MSVKHQNLCCSETMFSSIVNNYVKRPDILQGSYKCVIIMQAWVLNKVWSSETYHSWISSNILLDSIPDNGTVDSCMSSCHHFDTVCGHSGLNTDWLLWYHILGNRKNRHWDSDNHKLSVDKISCHPIKKKKSVIVSKHHQRINIAN